MMRRRTILAEEELKDGGIIVTRLLPVRIHHRHLVQIRQQRLNEWRVRRCKRNSRGSASRRHDELTAQFFDIWISNACASPTGGGGSVEGEREREGGVYHSLLAVEYRNPSLSSNRISQANYFFGPPFFSSSRRLRLAHRHRARRCLRRCPAPCRAKATGAQGFYAPPLGRPGGGRGGREGRERERGVRAMKHQGHTPMCVACGTRTLAATPHSRLPLLSLSLSLSLS